MPRFRLALRGYDRAQVDAFLDRVEKALNGGPPLPLDEIRQTRFTGVFRGYARVPVDELLHECLRELRATLPRTDRRGRTRVRAGWLATWIEHASFAGAGLLRPGYDMRDVDALLERVIDGLRGAAPPLTARDVRECAFRTVRLGSGYDEGEVDRFLDQLAAALERR